MEKENQPNNPNPVQLKLAQQPNPRPRPNPTSPGNPTQVPGPAEPAAQSPGAQPSSPPLRSPLTAHALAPHNPATSAQTASPFHTCQCPRALPATPGPRVSGSPFPFLSLSAAQRRGRDHRRVRRDLYPAAPRRDPRNPPIFGPCDPLFPIPTSQRRPANPSTLAPPHAGLPRLCVARTRASLPLRPADRVTPLVSSIFPATRSRNRSR